MDAASWNTNQPSNQKNDTPLQTALKSVRRQYKLPPEQPKTVAPLQIIEIVNALMKLFALQDRSASEKKLEFLAEELVKSGLTFNEIVGGIIPMYHQDLKQVKYIDIYESARRHSGKKYLFDPCNLCFSTGTVSMESESGYILNLACTCQQGEFIKNHQKVTQWNGQNTMNHEKFGLLKLYNII